MDETLRYYIFVKIRDSSFEYILDDILNEASDEPKLYNYKLFGSVYDNKLIDNYEETIKKCEKISNKLVNLIDYIDNDEENTEEEIIKILKSLNNEEFIIITNLVLTSFLIHYFEQKIHFYDNLVNYISERIRIIYHIKKYSFFIELFECIISLDEFI